MKASSLPIFRFYTACRFKRQAWIFAIAAVLLATSIAEGLFQSGLSGRFEHFYTDFWHRMAGVRASPSHATLVMVDDATLSQYPDEPLAFWTPHFAKAVETLKAAGARIVAIDFLFSSSPERWLEKAGFMANDASRDYDQAFRQQINRGNVLLAGFRLGEGISIGDFVLPAPDYLLAVPDMDMVSHIGLANLRTDPDGSVRHFTGRAATGDFVEKEGLPHFSFAFLTAMKARGLNVATRNPQGYDFTGDRPIAFSGPPGTFPALSFEKLLRPDALSLPEVKALSDKVVVIGAGFAGTNDVHPTPYSTGPSGSGVMMSGPEIQANIIETLLADRFVTSTSAPWRLSAFLMLFGALAIVGTRLSPWRMLLLVLASASVSAVTAYFLFLRDVIFPVASLHIGMIVVLVCLALMRLTREERERARIGTLFGRYVSNQVVEALIASPELPELGGQTRSITVLFSDIRNFTTLSEKLSAKEVVEMLNTWFERACAVLQAEGASIDKFIGDAVMAEFGAPLPQDDHALRALRAAVALHGAAVECRAWMKTRFVGRDLPEFDIGIGVHSGEAVMGNVGASTRMEYTAIGDTVNIASRLESKTREIGCVILASTDTVDRSGAATQYKRGSRHVMTVKGRCQPVEAFEILPIRA